MTNTNGKPFHHYPSPKEYDRDLTLEGHLHKVLNYQAFDEDVSPAIEESMVYLEAEGCDMGNLEEHEILNQPMIILEVIDTKWHMGRIKRQMSGYNYSELSVEDQSAVMSDIEAVCNINKYPIEFLGLEGYFNRDSRVTMFVQNVLHEVLSRTVETYDTASKLLYNLQEHIEEAENLYADIYGNTRRKLDSKVIDVRVAEGHPTIDVPAQGFNKCLDKYEHMFFDDSLLLKMSRDIYGSVETLQVIGQRGGEHLVKNIQTTLYNWMTARSHKSRKTRLGQEHVVVACGLEDLEVLEEGKAYSIDYNPTKMRPYEPNFDKFKQVLFRIYDLNFYHIEHNMVSNMDSYNNIMEALDSIEMTKEDIKEVITVCNILLELNTTVLVKVLEHTCEQVNTIASHFKENLT